MEPRFEPLASTSGLKVLDPTEKRQFSLVTPDSVSPSPASTDDFYFPVSVARSIRTAEIELPYTISVYVRDADGTMLADVEPPGDVSLPRGDYLVELSSPVKLYLRVESRLRVRADTDTVRLSFGGETCVTVGARSRHESPAGTVTVPDDPEGVMAGLSALGSSLKTTSPERSFPTLRGHPPRIERGERVDVPDDLTPPDTGVTVEVPPEYGMVYPVAPLAFYLGAEVVPGDAPRLRTDAGFEHRLDAAPGDASTLGDDAAPGHDSARSFEREVERVLEQTFFLDCVVRTEGYYPIELAERNAVESRLDFDLAAVYDRPLAERLETYLDVPYDAIEDATPTWHRVTFVRPDPENVELLPYVVDDLSLVRTPPAEESVAAGGKDDELWEAIDGFRRGPPGEEGATTFRGASPADRADESGRFVRAGGGTEDGRRDRNYVSLPDTDAIETAWAGSGTPTSGTKLLPAAYEHERAPPDDGVIDVTVVCNDSRMRSEWDAVSEIYGSRDDVPIEVDIEFGLGTDALRDLLAKPTDLFHYIGHVDDRGFDCIDGFLDAETVEEVGTKAFLLNACHSLNQGEALVEAGASAGIVSLSEVGNRSAMKFGVELTKMFHNGFSLGTALSLLKEYTSIGSRYIGLGDVGLIVAQNEDGNSILYEITELEGQEVTIQMRGFPNRDCQLGSIVSSFWSQRKERYINSGLFTSMEVSLNELEELISEDILPFVINGEVIWSNDYSDSLTDILRKS